jgi:hypothetical protein
MSRVVPVSRDELEERRAALLRTLDMSYDELAELAGRSALVGPEWEVWEAIQDIDFLLGDVG